MGRNAATRRATALRVGLAATLALITGVLGFAWLLTGQPAVGIVAILLCCVFCAMAIAWMGRPGTSGSASPGLVFGGDGGAGGDGGGGGC